MNLRLHGLNIISLLLITFSSACQTQSDKMKISEIAKGIEIKGDNYIYSEESKLEIGSAKYSLRSKAIYSSDGIIETLILYKPEGALQYSQTDIEKDKALLDFTGLPFSLSSVFENNNLKMDAEKTGNYILNSNDNNNLITIYKLD